MGAVDGPGHERLPFLERCLREWTLFRAITLGLPWHPDVLTESSDWFQHKTAATSNADALALLAEHGRTAAPEESAMRHGTAHSIQARTDQEPTYPAARLTSIRTSDARDPGRGRLENAPTAAKLQVPCLVLRG